MKVIVLGPVLWDSFWGHSQELSTQLSKRYNVTFLEPVVHSSELRISFQRTAKNPLNEIDLVKRNTSLGLNFLYLIYVELMNFYFLLTHDYDIFITYYTTSALLASIFTRLIGKKIVLVYSDDLSELYKPKTAKLFTKYLFTPLVGSVSNCIIATSHKLRDDVKKFNKSTFYIPNGVNINHFTMKTSVHNQDFVVGFIGSFGDWIDFDLILDVAKSLTGIKFVLVGSGEEFNSVKEKIERLNIKNIELTGSVPFSKIPEILDSMDICLIPFEINRLTDRVSPVKLFEYWAAGKPVISTDFYEIRKIADKKIIFINNSDELKESILQLKNNKEYYRTYQELGTHEVLRYDWNVLVKDYFEIFKDI